MKKQITTVIVLAFCFLGLSTSGNAEGLIEEFSFKLSFGMGTTMGGDMVKVIDGLNNDLTNLSSLLMIPMVGQLKNVNWGPEIEGEFLLKLSGNFGVSLGFGYMTRKKHNALSLPSTKLNSSGSLDWEPKYTAFPINLSGYAFLTFSPKVSAFIKAGAGYYFSKMEFAFSEENDSIDGNVAMWTQTNSTARDRAIGYHGSIGFEYDISRNIAVFVEGSGRYARFNNWEAQFTHNDYKGDSFDMHGYYWYVEEYYYDNNKYYPSLKFNNERPVDKWLRNVRKANISFSGISLRIGIRIGLGKK